MLTPKQEKLIELTAFRQKMLDYRKEAYTIVRLKCEGKLTDKEAMHRAYHETGMSTAELRTMMYEHTVQDINDAVKIIEKSLL